MSYCDVEQALSVLSKSGLTIEEIKTRLEDYGKINEKVAVGKNVYFTTPQSETCSIANNLTGDSTKLTNSLYNCGNYFLSLQNAENFQKYTLVCGQFRRAALEFAESNGMWTKTHNCYVVWNFEESRWLVKSGIYNVEPTTVYMDPNTASRFAKACNIYWPKGS